MVELKIMKNTSGKAF